MKDKQKKKSIYNINGWQHGKTKLNKTSGLSYSDRRFIDNEFYCYRRHSIKIYKAKSKNYFKHKITLLQTQL